VLACKLRLATFGQYLLSVIVDPLYADTDAAMSGNNIEIVRSYFIVVRHHYS
jgi:hypothetical protein